jgi:superoxide reductase
MTVKLQVYKCQVCGNIVEVVHTGGGTLVCCGKPMTLQVENTVEASKEKHIPLLEKVPDGWKVKVGSVAHPMQAEHYIEWIELIVDARACMMFLSPGEPPEAFFPIKADKVSARAYCNLHGLWKS